MSLKSVLTGISILTLAFVTSGCGLLGGNPTQGIGLESKNCLQNQSTPNIPQCQPGSAIMITPNVPVWGNETGDYFVNGVDQTNGTLGWFGENGDQPDLTP